MQDDIRRVQDARSPREEPEPFDEFTGPMPEYLDSGPRLVLSRREEPEPIGGMLFALICAALAGFVSGGLIVGGVAAAVLR